MLKLCVIWPALAIMVTPMGLSATDGNKWVYKDKRWGPLRRETFRRDNHKCQHCHKLVLHDVDHNHPFKGIIDHITPLSKDVGLAFELDNLQVLHKQCHDGAKQRQDKGNRMQRADGW